MHRDDLFPEDFDLLDLISDIGHFLDDLSDLGIDHYPFFNSSELYRLWLDGILDNDFLNNRWDLHNLLDSFGDWYKLFDNSIDWHLYFNRYDELSLHFYDLGHFYTVVDDLLNRDVPRHFFDDLDHPFLNKLMIDDLLLGSLQLDQLIYYSLHELLNLYVDVLFDDDLLDPFLDDWNLNDLLYFFDAFLDHDLGYDSLHDLNHFNDLLNDSRHNYDPLYDLLNLDHLRHFHHLLNDLFYWYLDFLDPVDMSQDLYYLLLDVFDGLRDFDVVIDYLLDLHDLDLSDYDRFPDLYDDWNLSLYGLDHWFFDDLLDPDDSLMDDWHLHDSFNLLWHFSDHLDDPFHDLLDLFDNLSLHDLLSNDLDLNRYLHCVGYLNDLLNDLRHFNDPFLSLDDDHRFLYDPIDNHMSDFNMVLNLFGGHDLNFFHDLLHNSFHFYDLRHSDDLLYDLLNKHRHLDQLLHNLFNMHDFLLDDFDLTDLNGHVIDNLADWNHLLHLHDLLDILLYYLDLGDFFDDLDDAVYDGWHFHCLLDDPFNMNDLLMDSRDDERDLNRDWNILFYFSDLLHLNYLLYDLLNHDDLWDFDDPIDDLLYNLLDLNYLGRDAEHLKDVIDVHHTHNLLVDQPDHTLIDLQGLTGSSLDLFEFLQQSLKQYSEMELHLSGLLR